MAVYVDGEANPFGRMVMCHMLADSIAELHAFAATIGIRREWYQPLSRPHYDLSKTRRSAALKAGAIEVTRAELVAIIKRCQPTWAAEYADARTRGQCHP